MQHFLHMRSAGRLNRGAIANHQLNWWLLTDIDKKYVPLWEKANLTLEEASLYFGIGQNKLRELTNSDNCPYVIWCGNKRLIKRRLFTEYLEKLYSI